MKPIVISVFALLLTGCDYFYNHISFNGTTPGIDTGIVLIKDGSGKTVFGANIKSGKFSIKQQLLATPGYYTLFINTNKQRLVGEHKITKPADEFEIYLEPGEYTINTGRKGLSHYPLITCSSKIQNDLSDYYPYADSMKYMLRNATSQLLAQLNSPQAQLMPPADYQVLVAKVKDAQAKETQLTASILDGFVTKYPQSEAIAHVMINTDYESDPVTNYKIYQKFSEAAKKSEDGNEIGQKLSHLAMLAPGALAPPLAGKTPDGKTIDLKAMHKKVILVEFWRAAIVNCRKHHQDLVTSILPNLADKGFGVISVSLDTKRDWWISAIKDDKMTWPQIADLKGFESPNVDNWALSEVPNYCLLDGSGHIIERNTEFNTLMFTVNNYLEKHP